MHQIVLFLLLLLYPTPKPFSSSNQKKTIPPIQEKMCGVNFVAPQFKSDNMGLDQVQNLNANWVALTPFAYMEVDDPSILFPSKETYWGNRPENLPKLVADARAKNLQVMLKPHFWIREKGWIGNLQLSKRNWRKWEKNYEAFMLDLARTAEELEIEIFCIGVEVKPAIKERPKFWPKLIKKVRQVYSGQLTYAANWDNYENIQFWDQLDYIGLDAYFPLDEAQTPSIKDLVHKWKTITPQLKEFAQDYQKAIIITEYGYRSCDFACWNQWEIESLPDHANLNLRAQVNGYQAFYQALWQEDWLAGAFLWKWHADSEIGGMEHSNYTPQNKPVEMVISNWYDQ